MRGLTATIQMASAIVCCCAPMYGPILPVAGIWSHLRWKHSSSYTKHPASGFSRGQVIQDSNGQSVDTEQGWVHLRDGTGVHAWSESHINETKVDKGSLRDESESQVNLQDSIHVRRSVEITRYV